MGIAKTLTTVSALAGLGYAVSKKKSFWMTAGITVLAAIAGAGAGSAIQSFKKN